MAKQVVYHWVEMRHIEVPDMCPTDSYHEMMVWLEDNNVNEDLVDSSTRDYEIVEVEEAK